ncbi:acyloxyacyl hydrolase [Cupriavidus basilensis]
MHMTRKKNDAGLAHRLVTHIKALGAMAALGTSALAHADPGVHVAFGRDPGHNLNKYEIGVNWDSGFALGQPAGLAGQAAVGGRTGRMECPQRHQCPECDRVRFFPPIFRLETRGGSLVPFLEASVGVRMMSHKATSDEHRSGSLFQFSDMIGVGMAFGPKTAYEAGFRYQHVSNAGIKQPNPGSGFYTGYMR